MAGSLLGSGLYQLSESQCPCGQHCDFRAPSWGSSCWAQCCVASFTEGPLRSPESIAQLFVTFLLDTFLVECQRSLNQKFPRNNKRCMRDFFILRRKSKGSSLVQMGVKAFFLGLADDALWFGSVKEVTKESN